VWVRGDKERVSILCIIFDVICEQQPQLANNNRRYANVAKQLNDVYRVSFFPCDVVEMLVYYP
jgi:hypothetical protein